MEVPSFGIPTLDIGDRQKGRLAAKSVVHCGTSTEEIEQGFRLIFSEAIQSASKLRSNPYEKEGTTDMIVSQLKTYPLEDLIQKSFYNL